MPEATPVNFKAATTQKEKKEVPIKSVQLTGSVALKILQHCTESDNAGACGQLLGLDVSTILEVTECFPFLVCSLGQHYHTPCCLAMPLFTTFFPAHADQVQHHEHV
jgi:hypothetical protein